MKKEQIRQSIDNWLKKLNITEESIPDIYSSFSGELAFGTAGLRGVMGIGTNRMNEYVIARASKGLAQKIKDDGGKSIAISYDSRINSEKFARVSAEVFAANGLKVYITKTLSASPLLSYAVKKLACDGGVMVTASHNPKEYNGYKVFDCYGCQIGGEYAKEVYKNITALDYFDIEKTDFEKSLQSGQIEYIPQNVYEGYLNEVKKQNINSCKGIKVCYTPLNGGGSEFVVPLLIGLGAEVVEVTEQSTPDGNFETCPYPNPEMPEALQLAKVYAQKNSCDIIIANDPDTDRIGGGYYDGTKWIFLSGDEIGLIICSYLLSEKSKTEDIKGKFIVRTAVTMRLIDKIAASFGVNIIETLTGFKNICAQSLKLVLSGEGEKFIAGYEESNGIIAGTHIFDKDGVSAAMLLCEIAAFLKSNNKTYGDYLNLIYKTYGTVKSRQIRVNTLEGGKDRTADVMTAFRKVKTGSSLNIRGVNDFLDHKTMPYNLLIFEMQDNNVIAIRPSGTEPFIKIYLHAAGKNYKENFIKLEKFVQDVLKTVIN